MSSHGSAARAKFYEFVGLWKVRDVDVGEKRVVFHALAVSALLTGLETAVRRERY